MPYSNSAKKFTYWGWIVNWILQSPQSNNYFIIVSFYEK